MLLCIKSKLNGQIIVPDIQILTSQGARNCLHHMASSGFDGLISWHLIGQIGRNHVTMNRENHTRIIENESP